MDPVLPSKNSKPCVEIGSKLPSSVFFLEGESGSVQIMGLSVNPKANEHPLIKGPACTWS